MRDAVSSSNSVFFEIFKMWLLHKNPIFETAFQLKTKWWSRKNYKKYDKKITQNSEKMFFFPKSITIYTFCYIVKMPSSDVDAPKGCPVVLYHTASGSGIEFTLFNWYFFSQNTCFFNGFNFSDNEMYHLRCFEFNCRDELVNEDVQIERSRRGFLPQVFYTKCMIQFKQKKVSWLAWTRY